MKKVFVINFVFLSLLFIGYSLIDKPLAVFCHNHIYNTLIYKAGIYAGSVTSSIQFRFIALIIGLIAAWNIFSENRNISRKYAFIFLSFYLSYFIAFILKYILARYRPDMLFSMNHFGFHFFSTAHNITSFPSGHAISAFSIAFALFFILKKKYMIALGFIIASIISIFRVIICAHFITEM